MKPAPSRLHGEGVNAAAGESAAEIAFEKVIVVVVRKPGAGVIRDAARPGAHVGHGRDQVGGVGILLHLPELLIHPRPAADGVVIPLISDAPTAVAAFDDIDPAGGVAVVGVVVAGEEIAVVVERK